MVAATTSNAASTGPFGREAEEIQFANLAARVASSARRVLSNIPLDDRRDIRILDEARHLLLHAVKMLSEPEGEESPTDVARSIEPADQPSYAFARMTRTALTLPRRSGSSLADM